MKPTDPDQYDPRAVTVGELAPVIKDLRERLWWAELTAAIALVVALVALLA